MLRRVASRESDMRETDRGDGKGTEKVPTWCCARVDLQQTRRNKDAQRKEGRV